MEKKLVKIHWHVAPGIQGYPKLSSLATVSFELLLIDGVIGVDDDENCVNAMNEIFVDARDIGKDVFILKCASGDVAGIRVSGTTRSWDVNIELKAGFEGRLAGNFS